MSDLREQIVNLQTELASGQAVTAEQLQSLLDTVDGPAETVEPELEVEASEDGEITAAGVIAANRDPEE